MVVKAMLSGNNIVTENSELARDLFNKGCFGSVLANGCVKLSVLEAVYLVEKKRLQVFDGRNKLVSFDRLLKRAARIEKSFWVRYPVFRDFRNRGYVIKTALKFGADFRVYDRGKKPGEEHAKWVVFAVSESNVLTWHDFAAKNRVAHSTRKKLLIGVVDDEGDVSYWEVRWVRP
ncbi:tRNA-intron lyase [Candidatus Woesearchaeota archaeon]|nr:MAG: tRNA-intron lyase [Candidatus Woesearchaeota archaeon]